MLKPQTRAAPRFFLPVSLRPDTEIVLPDRIVGHAGALRLRPGDAVTLFNGQGGEFSAEVVLLSKERSLAKVLAWRDTERESNLEIRLAQCISSGDRMDVTLQKATELGVAAIVPIESERSIVRLSDERAARRLTHWRNIVIAACEQCGRNRVPEVAEIDLLSSYVAAADPGAARLVLDPETGLNLRALPTNGKVELLVGAEGGLSDWEKQFAARSGFTQVRFGPRVLRTETAPLAAIAALQSLWGDC